MEKISLFFRFLLLMEALLAGMTGVAQKKVEVEKRPVDLVITRKPDEAPRFPEGNIQVWIARHVKYPREALVKKKEGRVFVRFVVTEEGWVKYPEVVHSSGNRYLDQEGVRVIGSMPKWGPARKAGRPVNVEFTTPVAFRLTHKTKPSNHEPMAPWDK